MRSHPTLVTAPLLAAAVVWGLRLAFSPDPFAPAAAALVAFSLVTTTLVAVAGILISRGRWSRRVALGVVGCEAALAIVMPLDVWGWVAIVMTGAGVLALTGPWLEGWLRQRPAAGGPGLRPMTVALGGVVLPGVAGIAAPGGIRTAHWALATTAVVACFGFSRATGWGLWGVRVALPVGAVWAASESPAAGALLILAVSGVVCVAAWSRAESHLAVRPLLDTLPGPRRSRPDSAGATP